MELVLHHIYSALDHMPYPWSDEKRPSLFVEVDIEKMHIHLRDNSYYTLRTSTISQQDLLNIHKLVETFFTGYMVDECEYYSGPLDVIVYCANNN